jgi:hypothetical protein
MKIYLYLFAIIILSGCTTLNKVISSSDVFKDSRSIHMRQMIKSVSDRSRPSISGPVEYTAILGWFGEVRGDQDPELILTFGIETSVRKDLLEPEIFFLINAKKYSLKPIERRLENFGEEESSTTEETKELKDDSGNTTGTVVTSSSTTSSVVPVRYVQYRYLIDKGIAEEIIRSEDFTIRFYLGDEGVSTRYKWNQKAALRKFSQKFLEL